MNPPLSDDDAVEEFHGSTTPSDEPLQQCSAMSEQENNYDTLSPDQLILQLMKKDNLIKKKDNAIETLRSKVAATSLHAVIAGNGIPPIVCKGSNFSHLNPKNHDASQMVTKKQELTSLIEGLQLVQEQVNEENEELANNDLGDETCDLANNDLGDESSDLANIDLGNESSDLANNDSGDESSDLNQENNGLIETLKMSNSILMPKLQAANHSPIFFVEADVALYVNLALEDAVSICNVIMEIVPSGDTKVQLIVRQEMSMFTNRCDHAVVYNKAVDAPIFCVETKKLFDKKHWWNFVIKNKSLGQSYDQLKAMQGLGHPCPLGALTTFNETYFTCLSPDIVWDKQPTLQSIKNIKSRTHKINPSDGTGTPLPLKVECSPSFTCSFEPDNDRTIYRSDSNIDQNNLVSALVVLILRALEVYYVPECLQQYTENQVIQRDCLQMKRNGYQWGKLSTSFKGPLCTKCKNWKNSPLHLLHHLGNGSTSRAYYAVTENGYGCVVKMYVESQDENGKLKTTRKFTADSKKCVSQEKDNYTKIYGEELRNYVHVRVLNGFYCLVMPFFDPIKVDNRSNDTVVNSITNRLLQFAEKKVAFHDCDINWSHIGCFNDNIYLYDLGDLVSFDDIPAAQSAAMKHLEILNDKASMKIESN